MCVKETGEIHGNVNYEELSLSVLAVTADTHWPIIQYHESHQHRWVGPTGKELGS